MQAPFNAKHSNSVLEVHSCSRLQNAVRAPDAARSRGFDSSCVFSKRKPSDIRTLDAFGTPFALENGRRHKTVRATEDERPGEVPVAASLITKAVMQEGEPTA
jgi:hypothetical protein